MISVEKVDTAMMVKREKKRRRGKRMMVILTSSQISPTMKPRSSIKRLRVTKRISNRPSVNSQKPSKGEPLNGVHSLTRWSTHSY